MKLISLNALCGHVFEPLMDFIAREAPSTDMFCFQEMLSNPNADVPSLPYMGRANVLEEIARRLPGFAMEFFPTQDDYDIEPAYPGQMRLGNATFYRDTLNVTDRGGFFVYNGYNSYDGKKHYETLGHGAVLLTIGDALTVVNVHGNSQPGNKLDTPKRLAQSQTIIDVLANRPGETIVMGDFNLMPDTESVRMFERAGFRNLIRDFAVADTRGSLMRALFPEYEHGPYGFQTFADYTFVTPGVTVRSFEVPDLPISDHLPMILEIDG